MYRDVDKWTRLSRLEKVKKPIEAGVVAIHPDELKSEDYIHQYFLLQGVLKKVLIDFFEVWQLWALSGPECPKVLGVPENLKKCPERPKMPKMARKCPGLPNYNKILL